MDEIGAVQTLRRYPVKSMLGEELTEVAISRGGVDKDRVFALIDQQTGRVGSAKQPRLWRALLKCRAAWDGDEVTVTLPDGQTRTTGDKSLDGALSYLLGRPVQLSNTLPHDAVIARPSPEDVIEQGAEAEVPYEMLRIGRASAGGTFVDYAPVSLMTTSTLEHLGFEAVRYRPNVVIRTPPSVKPFAENDWVGREIRLGPVRLRGLIPIGRCAIPTLEHGDLPRAVDAVRALLTENRIEVSDNNPQPCAGVYAEVLVGGTVSSEDRVALD